MQKGVRPLAQPFAESATGPPTEALYATCSISFVSTSLQTAHEKMSNSGAALSFGIVRTSFMVRRQRGHGIGRGS